ncbi:MAG: glycosyltransferase [Candidatus Sericytochromatia bacterium]
MDAGLAPMDFDCPYRILFGPLYNPSVIGRWLGHANILTFNAVRGQPGQERPGKLINADLHFDLASDSFADLLARLPRGWEPDLVIWYNLAIMGLPPGIEDCPYPTLAVVHDWPLNFQPTLDYVEAFDYVVADGAFLDVLDRIGHPRYGWWPCYGHDPLHHFLIPALERPYDVVFLGNMDYNTHRVRNPWLERLCRLGDRYTVLISDRYSGDDYTRLYNQSKIAFNFEQRKVLNMRTYEAAACGALVMCEADNREIRDFLVDGESCVLYTEADMEEKIAYYLAHDDERQRIARNGLIAIAGFTSEQLFARLLEKVPTIQAAFAEGGRQRFRAAPEDWKDLLRARHLSQCRTANARQRAFSLLNEAPRLSPESDAHFAAVAGALAINSHWDPSRFLQPQPFPPEAYAALQQLETAVARLPGQLWHSYNLACACSLLRQPAKALPLWQQLIPRLATAEIDLQTRPWLLPRGQDMKLHEFTHQWDTTATRILAGQASTQALNRLLLWQAFELSGYCLMWVQRPDDALQAFLQAEATGPGSYFTYTPLLQLLLQSSREQDLLACLQRAVSKLGLIESLQRDLIMTLLRRRRYHELPPILHFYRLLMQCFEGGSLVSRNSMQAWIPDFLVWLPELLTVQLEWAGIGNS